MVDVAGDHLEVDAFFGGVDGDGADGEARQGGDVAGGTALGLDDEDAAA